MLKDLMQIFSTRANSKNWNILHIILHMFILNIQI